MNYSYINRPELLPVDSGPQFANAYAQAIASSDPRYTVKQYDRGGISRGGSQAQQAGIDAAQNFTQGMADAYAKQADAAAYNAQLALADQQQRESTGQALNAFNANEAYANAMAQLQAEQVGMGMLGGLMRPPQQQMPPGMVPMQPLNMTAYSGSVFANSPLRSLLS